MDKTYKQLRDELNDVYIKLQQDKQVVAAYLEDNEIYFVFGYYALHSFKEDNEFYVEQYPIPVFTVNNIVDIGIDLDKVFFEFRFTRERALDFDFSVFEDLHFEVYGVEDYYDDFYYSDIEEIHNNILNSIEAEVGVSIIIGKDNILEDIINIIDLLMEVI